MVCSWWSGRSRQSGKFWKSVPDRSIPRNCLESYITGQPFARNTAIILTGVGIASSSRENVQYFLFDLRISISTNYYVSKFKSANFQTREPSEQTGQGDWHRRNRSEQDHTRLPDSHCVAEKSSRQPP